MHSAQCEICGIRVPCEEDDCTMSPGHNYICHKCSAPDLRYDSGALSQFPAQCDQCHQAIDPIDADKKWPQFDPSSQKYLCPQCWGEEALCEKCRAPLPVQDMRDGNTLCSACFERLLFWG